MNKTQYYTEILEDFHSPTKRFYFRRTIYICKECIGKDAYIVTEDIILGHNHAYKWTGQTRQPYHMDSAYNACALIFNFICYTGFKWGVVGAIALRLKNSRIAEIMAEKAYYFKNHLGYYWELQTGGKYE